jgi:hypothetical protein
MDGLIWKPCGRSGGLVRTWLVLAIMHGTTALANGQQWYLQLMAAIVS